MMTPVNLTVLGGSSVAVPELIATLIRALNGQALRVVLHGRDHTKLELVGRVCRAMASAVSGLTVDTSTDLRAALTGADFVLNQVRVGGLAARAYDETFPHRWNIPGEETVGPGGAANALRTIPVVLDLCRVIEEAAPQSTLLSFSNPASVVQRAITLKTNLKVIGLCDAPYTMREIVRRTLDTDSASLDTEYVGMHHFGWITSALVAGNERLPDVLASDSACQSLGIAPEIGRALGVLPHSYHRYFFHSDRMLQKQRAASQPRAREIQQIESDLLTAYRAYSGTSKPDAVNRRSAVWYETVIVPAFMALAFRQSAVLPINVVNRSMIEALPDDTIIEISAEIKEGEVRVSRPRQLPPPAALAMLQANAAYEQLLVEAVLEHSRERLLEAFLLNPLIPTYDIAHEVVEELWNQQGLREGTTL